MVGEAAGEEAGEAYDESSAAYGGSLSSGRLLSEPSSGSIAGGGSRFWVLGSDSEDKGTPEPVSLPPDLMKYLATPLEVTCALPDSMEDRALPATSSRMEKRMARRRARRHVALMFSSDGVSDAWTSEMK